MARVPRWAQYGLVVAGLTAALIALPQDECGGSFSGNCITTDLHEATFEVEAKMREGAVLPTGTVRVIQAAVTPLLSTSEGESKPPPGGSWVLVELQVRAADRPRQVTGSLERGEDRFTSITSPDGIPEPPLVAGGRVTTYLLFLLPTSATKDPLVLRVALAESGIEARIPLGRVERQDRIGGTP